MSWNLTRREILKAGAAGLAAPWILGAARSESAIRLGVATYSLRKFPRAKAIAAIQSLEVSYVSIKSFHLPYELPAAELAAARREFDDAGLKVMSSGNNTIKNEADITKLFAYAKAANFPLLVIAPTPEILPKVEAAVKAHGIAVAIHNHGPEDKQFPAPADALKRIKDMDPRVGICVDVGHTTRTGADVVKEIADAGARVLDLHMKDLKDLKGKNTQCPVGEGAMPVREIFRQLLKMKYGGCINLEYEIEENDPVAGMKKSFAHMRKVAAELEASGGK